MRAVRVAHAHWESFCRGEGEQGCILASPPERPESRLQSYRGRMKSCGRIATLHS
jgi:hypothetical protein